MIVIWEFFFLLYCQGNTLLMCLYVIGERRMCLYMKTLSFLMFICDPMFCIGMQYICTRKLCHVGVTAVERSIYHSWFKHIHSKLDTLYKLANLRTWPFFRKSVNALCHGGSHINWLPVILIPSLMNTIFNHGNSASIVYSPAVLVLLLSTVFLHDIWLLWFWFCIETAGDEKKYQSKF